ncbi:MAG: hypothetical protein WC858_05260 [Parcubacteria group bacterium]|jgi:hypothetical protein
MLKWLIGIMLVEVGGMAMGFVLGYYFPHEMITDYAHASAMVLWRMIGSIIMMLVGTILTIPKKKKI